jgi:DNA-binding LacI/PurR family transcriptional regulator
MSIETREKTVTMADIAELLHLSTSTVSRALNGSQLIATDTTEKVQKAATEMGFIINADARHLRLTGLQHVGTGEKQVTINNLAQMLNMSVSTVSRCFAANGEVSPKTKDRVLKAADEMGFKRQEYASRLRHGKNTVIAVLLSSLSDPGPMAILQGIVQEAERSGFEVIACSFFSNSANQRSLFAVADAFIIAQSVNDSENTTFKSLPKDKPAILLNGSSISEELSVTMDKGRSAAKSIINQLLNQGLAALKNVYEDNMNH